MASILLVAKWAALDRHNLEIRERIAREVLDEHPNAKLTKGTAPGDRRKLRGIPVYGMGGAIAGSVPHRDTELERQAVREELRDRGLV